MDNRRSRSKKDHRWNRRSISGTGELIAKVTTRSRGPEQPQRRPERRLPLPSRGRLHRSKPERTCCTYRRCCSTTGRRDRSTRSGHSRRWRHSSARPGGREGEPKDPGDHSTRGRCSRNGRRNPCERDHRTWRYRRTCRHHRSHRRSHCNHGSRGRPSRRCYRRRSTSIRPTPGRSLRRERKSDSFKSPPNRTGTEP